LIGLLPGIALIVFWQWAAGRLIKEIYISKPTAVAQRLYEIFASKEIYPHLWTTGQDWCSVTSSEWRSASSAATRSVVRREWLVSSSPT